MISRRVKNCRESVRLNLLEKAQSKIRKGDRIISFAGEKMFLSDRFNDELKAVIQVEKLNQRQKSEEVLKQAISEKLRIEEGLDYDTDQIFINPSLKMNLALIFQTVLNSSEEVILSLPYKEHYPEIIRMAGGIPKFINTDFDNSFKITCDELKNKITPRTRAVILNNSMLSLETDYSVNELIELANELVKRKILVISDEIGSDLVTERKEQLSIASVNPEIKRLSILMKGYTLPLENCSSGYVAGNKIIISEMKKVRGYYYPGAAEISKKRYGKTGLDCSLKLDEMVSFLNEQKKLMLDHLSQLPKIEYILPETGFDIYADISEVLKKGRKGVNSDNSVGFCEALLERENILVIPGEENGISEFIKLSSWASEAEIIEGLERILRFIENY